MLARVRAEIDDALGGPRPAAAVGADTGAARATPPAELDAVRSATVTLTCLAAITGRPALSAPFLKADGAPVGLGLIGPPHSDLDLVARGATLAPPAPPSRAPHG